jgi:LmbE family N-acetylglucosaminyl deacetylase
MVSTAIAGRGTTETEWAPWLEAGRWPELDIGAVAGRRVCVVAAHPDDEVLGAAGLLGRLAAAGHEIVAIWATDGEASHPGSAVMAPTALGTVRRSESRAALARLGVTLRRRHHLRLPDSGLAGCRDRLAEELAALVDRDDLVLCPWENDGHPDHEAVGRSCARLASLCWQFPIWMWHWAVPGDDRVPWQRFRAAPVQDVGLKAAAIEEFASQVRPIGPAPQDAPVLPRHVVARFLRPVEMVVV